jgi:hypothetical protein
MALSWPMISRSGFRSAVLLQCMKSGEQSLRIWVEDNSVTISNVIFLNVQAETKHLKELCLGVHKSFPNAFFKRWLARFSEKWQCLLDSLRLFTI